MISLPTSPSQNLQGASQTSGGFISGRALGNVFNLADASDLQMDLDFTLAVPGKVYIYESVSNVANLDPTKVKPQQVLKADVSRTIEPVLTKLGQKYSPIRSEFYIFIFIFAVFIWIIIAESNVRIHTYEDDEWTIKGRYAAAIEDDEEICWMKINQGYVLLMWLVSSREYISININDFQ